jgi:hypothetical protein
VLCEIIDNFHNIELILKILQFLTVHPITPPLLGVTRVVVMLIGHPFGLVECGNAKTDGSDVYILFICVGWGFLVEVLFADADHR